MMPQFNVDYEIPIMDLAHREFSLIEKWKLQSV